jgi:poly(A) polymerase
MDASSEAESETERRADEPRPRRRRARPERDDRREARPDERRDERREERRSRAGSTPSEGALTADAIPLETRPGMPQPKVYPVNVLLEHIDDDALKVIRRLRRHGHEAYLVGGGVRDLLLGVRPKDFDIATSARPSEVRSLFRNCRVIGRRFRLAHILFAGGKIIEVATFRRDPLEAFDQVEGEFAEEMDALEHPQARRRDDVDLLIRHDNVFGEPHEDALRRDFTINGLFFDSESHSVIDYVGGMTDIEGRVVRTIGAPDVRFREDPVRILRAIKFSARLDLGIDPDVYDAMVAQRDELNRAAKPRLLEEVLRLLRGGASHRSFWLLWETGCLGVLIPQLAMHLDDDSPSARRLWARLDAIDALKKADSVPPDTVLFAALMLGPLEEAIAMDRDPLGAYEQLMTEIAETLAVPRRMKERVRNMVYAQRRLASGKIAGMTRRDYFDDAAILFGIDCDARGLRRPEWLDHREPSSEIDAEDAPRRRRRRRR